jgi:hypothetical protein
MLMLSLDQTALAEQFLLLMVLALFVCTNVSNLFIFFAIAEWGFLVKESHLFNHRDLYLIHLLIYV